MLKTKLLIPSVLLPILLLQTTSRSFSSPPLPPPTSWQVVAKISLPSNFQIQAHRVGGLSGIFYETTSKILWTVTDARRWPQSKVFTFKLEYSDNSVQIFPHDVLSLHRGTKNSEALDAEGIALLNKDTLFISHEGSASGLFAAGISAFNPKTGQVLYALPIPHYFLPTPENPRQGIQQNRGFESLSLSSPNKDYLYTANESPLIQDLSDPSNASSGPIRILKFSLKNTDSPTEQRAYFPDQDAIFTSVPDLLCYYDSLLLVLERQILWPIEPRKRRIRIYSVDFSQPDATEIRNLDSLSGKKYTPLSKTLIFDSQLSNLQNVENFEGISWGPTWNNKPSLILVSDDNFSKSQKTEFLFLVPK